MDKELARYIAIVVMKSTSEMSRLIPIMKEELPAEEYEPLRKAITAVSKIIATDVLHKIFKEYPDIDASFKNYIDKYGKLP